MKLNNIDVLIILRIMLFLVLNFLIMFSFIFQNMNLMLIAVFLFTIHNLIFTFENLKNRLMFLLFQITFMVFLVLKPVLVLFSGGDLSDSINSNFSFPQEAIDHNIFVLLISVYSLFVTYYFGEKILKSPTGNTVFNFQTYSTKKVEFYSKIFLYICFIPALLILLEKALFVQTTSFTSYYTDYKSSYPFIIQKAGDIFKILFFVYLASMPTKKKASIPIILFLVYSVMSLGNGQRNEFILNIIILVFYFMIRDFHFRINNEKWFTKKIKYGLLILVPFLMIFTVVYDYLRRDLSIVNYSFLNLMLEFFVSQGGSNEIISHGYLVAEKLPPQNIFYSFGSAYNYITQNIIISNIFGIDRLAQNTVEMATRGNNFSASITYFNYPISYLRGIGMGSSYVAELYYDFGYFGVLFGNSLIAIILLILSKLMITRLWFFPLGLICLQVLLFIPRASYLDWVSQTFSILNVSIIMIIYLLTKLEIKYEKNIIYN